jgi:hypothetical protein
VQKASRSSRSCCDCSNSQANVLAHCNFGCQFFFRCPLLHVFLADEPAFNAQLPRIIGFISPTGAGIPLAIACIVPASSMRLTDSGSDQDPRCNGCGTNPVSVSSKSRNSTRPSLASDSRCAKNPCSGSLNQYGQYLNG